MSRVTLFFLFIFFLPSPPPKKTIVKTKYSPLDQKKNKKNNNNNNIGPMIRIGREIQCLPYVVFLKLLLQTGSQKI